MSRIVTLAKTNRKEFKRFSKFLVVGLTGFVVDFGILNLLLALGVVFWLAQSCSFFAAVVNNFTWNRYWTYPDSRTKPILGQLGMFAVLSLIGYAIRTPIALLLHGPYTALLQSILGMPQSTAELLGKNMAVATAVLVVLFWNFFANRFITYSDVKFGK
jgi:putative flippase GtrA